MFLSKIQKHYLSATVKRAAKFNSLFHGSDRKFTSFKLPDDDRGIYFTTNESQAKGYGKYLYRASVILKNPLVYSERDSQGDIEIRRSALTMLGYDGYIIEYDNGDKDVIVFDTKQIAPKASK